MREPSAAPTGGKELADVIDLDLRRAAPRRRVAPRVKAPSPQPTATPPRPAA